MGDLISRKEAKKLMNDTVGFSELERTIFGVFLNQVPIAYDMDKVITQLNEVKADCEKYNFFETAVIVGKYIAIVKAGGRDE